MMGTGIGFGGTILLGEGTKRILKHVSSILSFPTLHHQPSID
jgi:hypothetical protein